MDYTKLQSELVSDPVTLGYAGKTDQLAADLLNSLTTSRQVARTQVSKREIFNAIADADWPTTALPQNKLVVLFSQDWVDPTNVNVRAIVGSIFVGKTNTINALLALDHTVVSRATELGLGGAVSALDVNRARAGAW